MTINGNLFSIKFNNMGSRVRCPACETSHRPAVGLQIIKGYDFDIVCDPCGWRHAPELAHALQSLGSERWRHGGWGEPVDDNAPEVAGEVA